MAPVRRVTLSGSPRERGVTHGETFAEEIRRNVATYEDEFAHRGVDVEEARDRAREFIPRIEQWNEAYVAEMRGVAAGSDVPLADVAMINVRYEVMYDAYTAEEDGGAVDEGGRPGAVDAGAIDGCTSFGVQPEVTADGHTYVGQNWDWLPAIETFLMDVRPAVGPNLLALTEAGMVGGKWGVNEHGIGYAVNGLATPADGSNPLRKPTHVRGREILHAERLDQALEPVLSPPRPGSRNYLIGHAAGEMIDLETAPDTVNYLYPSDGLLTHANHFTGGNVDSLIELESPHTLLRDQRLRRLLARDAGAIDVESLQSALRDDFGHPNGICRYVEGGHEGGHGEFHTKASVIMDLTDRRLLVTDGPPRDTEYHVFAVA